MCNMSRDSDFRCPICNCTLNPRNLARHLARNHSNNRVEGYSASHGSSDSGSTAKASRTTSGAYIEYDGQVTVDEYGIVVGVRKVRVGEKKPRVKKSKTTVIPAATTVKKKSAKPAKPTVSRVKSPVRKQIKAEASCPICLEELVANQLIDHLRLVHQVTPVLKATRRVNPQTPLAGYKCNQCGQMLHTLDVKEHQTHCRKRGSENLIQQNKKMPGQGDVDILCGVCNRYVHPKHITEHERKFHPRVKFKPAGSPHQTTADRKHIPSGRNAKAVNFRSRRQLDDDGLDGSKYLGHFRRESSGQFGSYPLHDDYGDESDAD